MRRLGCRHHHDTREEGELLVNPLSEVAGHEIYDTGTECGHTKICRRTERKSTLVISLLCHVLSKHVALVPSLALPCRSRVIVCSCCTTSATLIMRTQLSMLMRCTEPGQCIPLRYYAHCLVLAFSGKTFRDTCRIAHSRCLIKMLYTTNSHC